MIFRYLGTAPALGKGWAGSVVTVLPLPPLPPMRFLAAACCFLLRSSHSHTDGSYERQGTSWRAGDGRFDDGSATTGGGDDRDDSDDCGTVPLSCRPDCAAAIVAAAHACSTRGGGALQLVAGVYHLNPANDTGKGLGLSGTISSRTNATCNAASALPVLLQNARRNSFDLAQTR